MSVSPLEFVEMQQRLRTDGDGTYKREVLDLLDAYGSALKRQLDAGLPPDEFSGLSSLKTSVDEAKMVVEMAWAMTHSQSQSNTVNPNLAR